MLCYAVSFTQAGSEVSALLGRIPSAVGYQPTLATDMGLLQVLYVQSIVSPYLLWILVLLTLLSYCSIRDEHSNVSCGVCVYLGTYYFHWCGLHHICTGEGMHAGLILPLACRSLCICLLC